MLFLLLICFLSRRRRLLLLRRRHSRGGEGERPDRPLQPPAPVTFRVAQIPNDATVNFGVGSVGGSGVQARSRPVSTLTIDSYKSTFESIPV